jgi:hypothetical protein
MKKHSQPLLQKKTSAAFTQDRWLELGDSVHFVSETREVRHCSGRTHGLYSPHLSYRERHVTT